MNSGLSMNHEGMKVKGGLSQTVSLSQSSQSSGGQSIV